MFGLMQDRPLMIASILGHAARHHRDAGIVTNTVEGGLHRCTYAEAETRAKRLARALEARGVQRGERIGTLAWNTWRHLEIYYGVSGMGAVCHTINPRLFPDQIVYIVGHAEDTHLFVDLTFVPLVEAMADHLPKSVRTIVVLTDHAHMPAAMTVPAGVEVACYEDLLAEAGADYTWPEFDENTASSLCYTSGTTGAPKGVLYSHRSTVLHALGVNAPDVLGLRAGDRVMPVVPMFHVNAWGTPYAAPAAGATLVMPGPHMDGASLQKVMEGEGVTAALGVPTVWLGLLDHLRKSGTRIDGCQRLIIGGSACPRLLFEAFDREYGVRVDHAWGMTEMSPLGTYNTLKPRHAGLDGEALMQLRLTQGRAIFGVDMKIVDGEGTELPWDGKAFGNLMVKGPWVCRAYFGREDEVAQTHDADGWFRTGDVATIDPDGYMRITDRTKDVVKSGGEWISSIELENIAVGHPDVAEAAVIAARHPKWDERPLLIVVPRDGREIDPAALLAWFDGKVAKWWIPDAVLVVDQLPHTATGKLQKTALRDRYADHLLTGGGAAAE
ncbi:MAG: long-chain-fatty-acid--CoA ligase [Caenispirillum bisanense]|nr:long-chain-fatty-acid--CoA ligase [Caenispirillum bisanense]MCA1974550.1 long-chain-fatty-acid--CoA ligase [Caenispirillum sp.]